MTIPIVASRPPLTEADGVIRIGKTRVTLDTVIAEFHEGATAEEITQQYPALMLGDVYSVIGYYLQHRAVIDNYLHEGEQEANRVRQENEARFDPAGVRARLLSRRN